MSYGIEAGNLRRWCMQPNQGKLYSFAGYRFDPESGELLHLGLRVRLGKQTADILAVLIANAGLLVSRQSLRHLLWPAGEQVNHEKIINNGISRLRFVFQDDPQAPKFIERVPKRGYRWVMPVETLEQPGLGEVSAAEVSAEASTQPVRSVEISRPRLLWPWLGLAGLVVTAGAIFAGISSWHARHPAIKASSPVQISLAVAPLDASGTGASELAGSFRLDLTEALAQLPQVQVRSAHSVNQLRLTDASLPAYSAKLGLDVILFGSFTRDGQRCELQFELVRVKDALHIATLRYTGTVDQLTTIRDKIQRDVFAKLQLAGEANHRPPGSTSDPEAYRLYLQAHYYFSEQSAESLARAVTEYQSAIDRDPHFAKAYIGIAQTYLIMLWDHMVPPDEAFGHASDAVSHALRLDESSAEVHSILGFIRFYRDWDLEGGVEEEQVATRLDPHQPIYHQWLTVLLCDEGRYAEAQAQLDLALADDPYWPSLYVTQSMLSSNDHDSARMLSAARRLKELLPASPLALDNMANALWYSGQPVEAIAEWRRMALLEHDTERVAMEDRGLQALRRSGVKGYARVRLEALHGSDEPKRHPNDFVPEEWYMAAGDMANTLAALKALAVKRNPVFLERVMSPMFKGIRRNPEFVAMIANTSLGPQLPELAR